MTEETQENIRATYLQHDLPWYVAFSGGKDSTAVLQLVYRMLLELPPEQRTNHVYALSVDTGVENPLIWLRIHETFEKVASAADRDGLPITTHILRPQLATKTFWVRMIGYGLSPPRFNFRWCTGKLKIEPQRRFVRDLGRSIAVVGDRIAESAGRGDRMRKSGIGAGTYICPHPDRKRDLKYSPIADWSDADVFSYLRSTPSPWGDDNAAFLDTYYGSASRTFGGCCLHACGAPVPRSGCWVCTVAKKDRSIMIPELEPLREYRSILVQLRDDTDACEQLPDGKLGKLKMEVRERLLDELTAMTENNPALTAWCADHHYTVISQEEIEEIHRVWKAK